MEQQTPIKPVFKDAALQFQIQHPDGTITDESIDIVILKMLIDRNQSKHFPDTKPGQKIPVEPEFIRDLADDITGFGVACSPCIAYYLWFHGTEAYQALKKNTGEKPNSPTASESSPEK